MKNLILSLLGLGAANLIHAEMDVYHFSLTTEEAAATHELSLGDDASPTGSAIVVLDRDTATLHWNIRYADLTGELSALHFHGPAGRGESAPPVVGLTAGPSPIVGSAEVDGEFTEMLDAGRVYLNLHTPDNPAGEIRGQVVARGSPLVSFSFPLGTEQVPDSGSLDLDGANPTGSALVAFNLETMEIFYHIEAEDLTTGGDPTAMHFHGPAAPGESAGVSLGLNDLELPAVESQSVDEAQATQLLTGQWYLNLHTDANPGGEIRGHLVPALEPVESFTFPLSTRQSQNDLELGDAMPSGTGSVIYDPSTERLVYTVTFDGLTDDASAMHFHGPADFGESAGVLIPIDDATSPSVGSEILTEEHANYLRDGLLYVNVHTPANPGGEIRGQVIPYNGVERLVPLYGRLTPEAETGDVDLGDAEPSGAIIAAFDPALNTLHYALRFEGLTGDVTGMHFHGPAAPGEAAGVRIGLDNHASPQSGAVVLSSEMKEELTNGLWYLNVHTEANPAGEIRAQVDRPGTAVIPFQFPLSAEQSTQDPELGESDPAGSVAAVLNIKTGSFAYRVEAADLSSELAAMHFHGPAGVGEAAGVVLGVDNPELPAVRNAVLTTAQMNQLLKGQWYFNVHTDNNPGGEIRGQVIAAPAGVTAIDLRLAPDQHEDDLMLDGATPSGRGLVLVDSPNRQLLYQVDWQGLTDDATAAHFHGPADPGESAGVEIPIDDITPPAVGWTSVTETQLMDILDHRYYVNVHTTANPSGEIRGQVMSPQQLFFSGAEENANGWWTSDWFGGFYGQDFPWVYQPGLGWLYALNSGITDLFIYDLVLGTIYTRAEFYPHLYSYRENAWLYYFGTENGRRHYWHHGMSDHLFIE